MKKHTITFDQAGGIKVNATGFVGRACEATTQKLMQGIGASAVKDDKKKEYYQRDGAAATQTQRW